MDSFGIVHLHTFLDSFNTFLVWSMSRWNSAEGTLCIRIHFCNCMNAPPQIIFPQHDWYFFPVVNDGKVKKQIGQSSFNGGCLNRASSCNSAARFLHSLLCWGRCALWQAALQYFTAMHAEQFLSWHPSLLPQFAHDDIVIVISATTVHIIYPKESITNHHACLGLTIQDQRCPTGYQRWTAHLILQ